MVEKDVKTKAEKSKNPVQIYWTPIDVGIPEDIILRVSPRQRQYLRLAMKKIRTIQKYLLWQLQEFNYQLKVGWDGFNPYFIVKILLVDEHKEKDMEKLREKKRWE